MELEPVIIMVALIVMGFGTSIVKMLIGHQQKMTELTHNRASTESGLVEELRAMRRELTDVKDKVNQLSIEQDRTSAFYRDALASPVTPPARSEVEERLRG